MNRKLVLDLYTKYSHVEFIKAIIIVTPKFIDIWSLQIQRTKWCLFLVTFIACLLVCLGFFVPLENFSLIWRRHHYRWRTVNFDLCSTLMTIEQRATPFIMVICEDPWHLHLLPRVWQWNCHYLFSRAGSVAAGIRIPNLPHAMRTLLPTAPTLRLQRMYTCLRPVEYNAWCLSCVI